MGNEISQIDTGFFICGVQALEVQRLKSLGIKSVLNVAQRTLYLQRGSGDETLLDKLTREFTVEIIGAEDCEQQDLSVYFERMADFIEEGRQAGGVVVHCAAGISRASTSCIAYLMLKQGLKPDAAFRKIHRARNIVHPNAGFWRQLRDLEQVLLERGVVLRDLESDELPPKQQAKPFAERCHGDNLISKLADDLAHGRNPTAVASSQKAEERSGNVRDAHRDANSVLETLDHEARSMESFTSVYLTAQVKLKPNSIDAEAAVNKLREVKPLAGLVWANFEVLNPAEFGARVGLVASRGTTAVEDIQGQINGVLGEEHVEAIRVESGKP